jgi:hypothetical protein
LNGDAGNSDTGVAAVADEQSFNPSINKKEKKFDRKGNNWCTPG